MPRTTVTANARTNARAVVAPDRPDAELAGERAEDQEDRRRPDERQDVDVERLGRSPG